MNIDNKGSASAQERKYHLTTTKYPGPAMVQSAVLAALGC
ncbi:rCG27307 [Rattus norvegicus]|uniref:RCG27307 n=1 Tax=Rattus norvegicus TaxID=10116 RepID=A6HP87_RAT|nr:rCG27307 [Rattus norvegicus]